MSSNKIAFSTSVGVARYPWLKEPDTAFGQESFKCMLILSPKEGQPLVELINKTAEQAGFNATNGSLPYETDEETGDFVFKTKTNFQPKFFDSAGAPIIESKIPDIWGGSQLKLSGWIAPWSVNGKRGITLQLMKVMVVEARGPSDTAGGSSGFEPVEGGFVAEKEETFEAPPSDAPSYL